MGLLARGSVAPGSGGTQAVFGKMCAASRFGLPGRPLQEAMTDHAPAWLFSFVDLAFLLLIAMTQVGVESNGIAMELGEIVIPRIQSDATQDLVDGDPLELAEVLGKGLRKHGRQRLRLKADSFPTADTRELALQACVQSTELVEVERAELIPLVMEDIVGCFECFTLR